MSKIEQVLNIVGLKVNQEFKWLDKKVSGDAYLCKIDEDGAVYVWSTGTLKWVTQRSGMSLTDVLRNPENIKDINKGPVVGDLCYWYCSDFDNPKIWSIEPITYNGSAVHIAMYDKGFMFTDSATALFNFDRWAKKYGVVLTHTSLEAIAREQQQLGISSITGEQCK